MILMNHAMMGAAGYQAAAGGDQLFWTPDAADVGGPPSDITFDWPVGAPSATVEVAIESQGDWPSQPFLRLKFGSNSFAFLRLLSIGGASVPESDEIEIYAQASYFSIFSSHSIAVKIQPGTQTGYNFRPAESSFNAVGPGRTFSSLGTLTEGRPIAYRLRAGNTEQKAKAWTIGDPEPAWEVESTHTAFPGPGSPGFLNLYTNTGDIKIGALGIGLNGASAPMEPI